MRKHVVPAPSAIAATTSRMGGIHRVAGEASVSSPLSLLLPGLDGTGDLFAPFVAAAPPGLPLAGVRLPADRPRGYPELAAWLLSRLPPGPLALIAESFSGPLALLVADRCPRVAAVVLCASFAAPPWPRVLARTPAFVWGRPPPAVLVRAFLTGGDHAMAAAVGRALAGVGREVLAARIAAALRTDVTAELGGFSRPLLCLRATRDRVLRVGSTEQIRAVKPAAEFVEIAAPHLLLQTKPVEAWIHIAPFLKRAAMSDNR
jgi:pimeloyl-ACP methyl ester carboxylesterase